jgi:DNA processing protein
VSDAERSAWLRLARSETVGPVTFRHLLSRYGSARAALDALPALMRRAGRMDPGAIPSLAAVEDEIAVGEAMGATLLCGCEPEFPESLATLDPPPPIIWALGDITLLRRRGVAVVGARIASAVGRRFAREIAGELGREGLVVVSGLARGVDSAAHEGSLATGTVAVLGGGVGDIYPPENEALYGEIARRGCIVSESEPNRRAQARDFPRRNRLISGLSLAVVVVEAELKSGSLITARLAAEQGREVLAVPGSPLDPRARGCNDLIRQGAAICEGAEDVLRAIEPLRGFAARQPDLFEHAAEDAASDALRESVFELLSPTPVAIDELARLARAPTAMVLAALLELAIADRATLLPGAMVARA